MCLLIFLLWGLNFEHGSWACVQILVKQHSHTLGGSAQLAALAPTSRWGRPMVKKITFSVIFTHFLTWGLVFELGSQVCVSDLGRPALPHAWGQCPTCCGGAAKPPRPPNDEKSHFFSDFCSFFDEKTQFGAWMSLPSPKNGWHGPQTSHWVGGVAHGIFSSFVKNNPLNPIVG